MARIDSIFRTETKRSENHPKRITKWIHYTKLKDHKKQYCNGNRKEIEKLADLIETSGEVLQDLCVRKIDTDEYEIIAGHKRCQACKLLVEERGKEEYAFLPCYIKNMSDVQSEFSLYSSNGYHDKTDYEKMHELEKMKYLLENFPEEFPQVKTGRIVEKLAKLLNMKKSTVGEYLTIAKNLGEKGMEKFQAGELKKSAAVELSGMPVEQQDSLIEQGITSHREIKKIRQENRNESGTTSPEREKETYKEKEESQADDKKDSFPPSDERKNPAKETRIVPDQPQPVNLIHSRESEDILNLKNNEERKKWLRDYKSWGIWYIDEHIGCTYYKYDFANGARLIAETYKTPAVHHMPEHESCYLHLVGGPKPPKYGMWERHENYVKFPDSETALVEFLKYAQKGNSK